MTDRDLFIEQYRAERWQRLDGYDARHREARTDAAFERARAKKGETPKKCALPLLGVSEAKRVAERLLARERVPTPMRLTAWHHGA